MFKDIFRLKDRAKGQVLVKARKPGGEWFTVLDKKNDIVANAATLISKALAGEAGWKINRIQCLKASVELAIESVSYSFPGAGQVQFESTFSTSSFNDTVDEVRLTSVDGGDFSVLDSLSVEKSDEIELNIQWLLTII